MLVALRSILKWENVERQCFLCKRDTNARVHGKCEDFNSVERTNLTYVTTASPSANRIKEHKINSMYFGEWEIFHRLPSIHKQYAVKRQPQNVLSISLSSILFRLILCMHRTKFHEIRTISLNIIVCFWNCFRWNYSKLHNAHVCEFSVFFSFCFMVKQMKHIEQPLMDIKCANVYETTDEKTLAVCSQKTFSVSRQ